MRILFITDPIPYPTVSGGRLRLYNLIRRVARHHEVALATHLSATSDPEGVTHMQRFCSSVVTGTLQRKHPVAHLPGLATYAVQRKPLELKFWYCPELGQKIRQLAAQMPFDIVQIEETRMAQYQELFPRTSSIKRILTFYDIRFAQASRFARYLQKPAEKARLMLEIISMRLWEPRYAAQFDRCITVSKHDRALLVESNPQLRERVTIIPNGVDTHDYQPLPRAESRTPHLMFIGHMNYFPCVDAAHFFCSEILPTIRQTFPNTQMWFVGSNPRESVQQLAGDGVYVTGRVPEIIPYYQQTSICVVPLRAGGGTRLKILEAMALGRPVITTTIGAEGLDVVDNEHLLIADSPEAFAQKTIRLLSNPDLYASITTNARQFVVKHYDWDGIARQQMDIYDELVASNALTTANR